MNDRYNSHRRAFGTPFWTEGWALYWEMLLWDLGFPQSPEDRVGMLFWRMHRTARIIFSLGFHLGTMTPQECIDFLVDRVGHERANAEGEVRRSFNGSYSPLYQVAYMIGGLQFRALHRELVGAGKMTNREFHDAILKRGRMPVEMVRASLVTVPLRRDYKAGWKFYQEPGGRTSESRIQNPESGRGARGARSAEAKAAELTAEATRLVQVLKLDPNATVADIGAGSGEMTVAVGRRLGTGGRVYSTDINKDRLREIREASDAAGLKDVVVVEGHADRTNLPDACCDAIFVRHVYHHFADPPAMNASIRRSLKPGGRFAVMDFVPDKTPAGTVPPAQRGSGEMHGVMAETVVEELQAAGFQDVQIVTREWPGGLFLVLARNP
jgi:precorrin-6B methylase 2